MELWHQKNVSMQEVRGNGAIVSGTKKGRGKAIPMDCRK